ncbi:MAG TPA: hypothetical protein VGJ92_02840 [Methanocella sp.]|jgi:hypothetical protein
MSSLETGRAHGRLKKGCNYRIRIKPRQACNCRGTRIPRHRNEAGGIYDDDPLTALSEGELQNQA